MTYHFHCTEKLISAQPVQSSNSFAPALFSTIRLLTICVLLMVSLSACAPKPADDKAKAEAEKAAAAKDSAASDSKGGGDEAASAEEALPPGMKGLPFEELSLPMRDHLLLYGRLYSPGMQPEGEAVDKSETDGEGGPKFPLVILLHGLNHTYSIWGDLPAKLVKSGYAVISLDLRGHGKSTRTEGGRRITWRRFKKEQWADLPGDIGQVIHTFTKSEDYPKIDGQNVALIGEKLGANVAVLTTQKTHDAVKALTLLSPGLDYKGLSPSQALLEFTKPVLLLTSQDDEYGNKSTHGLYNWILGQKTLLEYGRIGDGAEMLVGRPAISAAILDWLEKSLPPGQLPAGPISKNSSEEPASKGAGQEHS
jgi:pimeloyl-ACP methyl ester carboxylesterase